jgi:hypothetical protein
MADLDIALLPFFPSLEFEQVSLCTASLRIDFARHGLVYLLKDMCSLYPDIKDTNNMLKYFMDALTRVVYDNNNCLVTVAASKAYPGDNRYGTTGWAEVRVSSIHY